MPLKPIDIKIRIMRRGDTIAGLARKWNCWDNDIHRVIQRTPGRALPDVRRKLANYLGVSISEVGREPAPKPKKKATLGVVRSSRLLGQPTTSRNGVK